MLHSQPAAATGLGSCSSASNSSAASTASSGSLAGSEGRSHQQQHLHHHQHHHHHNRRPSTSSSITTVTTAASSHSGGEQAHHSSQHHQHHHHRHSHQLHPAAAAGETLDTAEAAAAAAAAKARRLRTVRLTRPCISGSSRRVALQLSTGASTATGGGVFGVGGGVQATTFGFAVRGGREFGIGFFVSRVDRGGEADLRGLRVGDQLVRINGYAVDDAVHRELSQYVACQDRLTLKVRGVGVLPVKDRQSDALSWHAVPGATPTALMPAHSTASSVSAHQQHQQHQHQQRRCTEPDPPSQDVRITLDVEPRTKLGLGICKGPEWKPGIFVQFTKEVGVARDAGLRPGDQLLSCNGVDFADVLFSEAVAVMKASQHLEMVVRTAAGVDLFPGESSGYNSSASSVTGGDQSPCWGDQSAKRLSMVREEDAMDKITHNQKLWERSDHDRRPDRRLHSVQPPVVPATYRPASQQSTSTSSDPPKPASAPTPSDAKSTTNTTIIKLSETGTIINNTMVPLIADQQRSAHAPNTLAGNNRVHLSNGSSGGNRSPPEQRPHGGQSTTQVADIRFVSRKIETKTVTVEVHRGTDEAPCPTPDVPASSSSSSSSSSSQGVVSPPPPPPPPMMSLTSLSSHTDTDGSHSSLQSGPMSTDAASLTSAISEELKKRAERGRYEVNPSPGTAAACHSVKQPAPPPPNGRIALKKSRSTFGAAGPNSEDKHNALIDEFKLAHRKMFRNAGAASAAESTPATADASSAAAPTTERQLELRGCGQPPARFDKITRPYPGSPSPDYDEDGRTGRPAVPHTNGGAHSKPANGTGGGSGGGGTMGRCAAHEMAKATGDAAELESIDSYKLTNPASPPPKPPSSYFQLAATGPATLKKPVRSVAVTIGEYGGARKEAPRQFDFIASQNGGRNGGVDTIDYGNNGGNGGGAERDADVSHRLKSELESTLSRSNLKTRTDGGGATEHSHPATPPPPQSTHNPPAGRMHSMPTPPLNGNQLFGNGRPLLHKTQSNVEKITAMLVSQNLMGSRPTPAPAAAYSNGNTGNRTPPPPPPPPHQQSGVASNGINAASNGGTRVTINVGNTAPTINGILKNGSINGSSSPLSTSASATSLEQRNISFGNITTVLTDNM